MATAIEARWQWRIEDDGRLICGAAIVNDFPGRGWFVGFPGQALQHAGQLRPLLRAWRILCKTGAYRELRAWVEAGDQVAQDFASHFGFRRDCGPARGMAPCGADMDLYLWRAEQ